MDSFQSQSGGARVRHGHQETDFNIRAIVVFFAFLVISGIITFFLADWLMRGFEWWEKGHDPKLTQMEEEVRQSRKGADIPDEQARVKQRIRNTFVGPRLQDDETVDMDRFRQSENRLLNETGKDANGNIHIPVSRAIDILTERGLPSVSGPFLPKSTVPIEPGLLAPQGVQGEKVKGK
ncbi:MAG TPA: hypothetical protein VKZ53_06605 [Candidatus Angelobacter sp.]|nr:hypothetical protein [Candidatus Angelobacter sp.]